MDYNRSDMLLLWPLVWNTLPDNIRTSESLIPFKRATYNFTVRVDLYIFYQFFLYCFTQRY